MFGVRGHAQLIVLAHCGRLPERPASTARFSEVCMSEIDGRLSEPSTPYDAGTPPLPARPGLLSLWFGLSSDVTRLSYAATGFGLMAFKYAIEVAVLWH